MEFVSLEMTSSASPTARHFPSHINTHNITSSSNTQDAYLRGSPYSPGMSDESAWPRSSPGINPTQKSVGPYPTQAEDAFRPHTSAGSNRAAHTAYQGLYSASRTNSLNTGHNALMRSDDFAHGPTQAEETMSHTRSGEYQEKYPLASSYHVSPQEENPYNNSGHGTRISGELQGLPASGASSSTVPNLSSNPFSREHGLTGVSDNGAHPSGYVSHANTFGPSMGGYMEDYRAPQASHGVGREVANADRQFRWPTNTSRTQDPSQAPQMDWSNSRAPSPNLQLDRVQ